MPAALDTLPRGARVLLVRLRSLGDCVLTTPAIHLLKQYRPDLRLAVMVEPRFAELYAGNSDIDAILAPGYRAAWAWRAALTLNLHGGTRSALLTAASGARLRAGFAHYRFQALYNLRIPRAQETLGVERKVHTAEHVAAAMFWLGVPRCEIPRAILGKTPLPDGRGSEEEEPGQGARRGPGGPPHQQAAPLRSRIGNAKEARVAPLPGGRGSVTEQGGPLPDGCGSKTAQETGDRGSVMAKETGDRGPEANGVEEAHRATVVIHPFASAIGKAWPAERFVELARWMRERWNWEPVILGGAADEFAPFGEFRCLRGAPLNAVKAELAGARLFVGNDSGPAHMAAAYGLPVVVLYGSSDPVVWAPWRTRAESIVEPGGLARVDVERVQAAVERLVARG
jgi:ADP-heptose:LPS heptosyltransferase